MPECAVCGGPVREYDRIETARGGERVPFCSDEHKEEFERAPELFE